MPSIGGMVLTKTSSDRYSWRLEPNGATYPTNNYPSTYIAVMSVVFCDTK